jgi:hypothetical protein
MVLSHPPAIPREHLSWHRCHRQAGHGVASGRASDSPYPAGTLALQRPAFMRCGLDLGTCFNGTLNLLVPGGEWRLAEPALRINHLAWTPLHPPETFSFWPCLLRWPDPTGAGTATTTDPLEPPLAGWIYWPHPETKRCHHQPAGQLEVLMPWIPNLAELEERPGGLELGVDGRHCRLIQPARLRARLLEFLKFRVLAAQESFFSAFESSQAEPPWSAPALRAWLASVGWREALDLSDADLLAVLATARRLYVN